MFRENMRIFPDPALNYRTDTIALVVFVGLLSFLCIPIMARKKQVATD
jgi:hypothetical protein